MTGGFDKQSARRVAEATKRIEKFRRNRVDRPKGRTSGRDAVLLVTNSTIAARAGSSPNFTLGKGTADVLAIVVDGSLVASTSSPGTSVAIYHGGTTSIPSGTLVQCKWVGPVLIVDTRYC